MTETSPDILVVEDDRHDSQDIREVCKKHGVVNNRPVTTVRAALQFMQRYRIDTIVLDLTLEDSGPVSTMDAIHLAASSLSVIVVTGYSDPALTLKAASYGWTLIDKNEPNWLEQLDARLGAEESQGPLVNVSQSQIDAIVAALERIESKQAEMSEELRTVREGFTQISETIYGKKDPNTGLHEPGCYKSHLQWVKMQRSTKQWAMMQFGKVLGWIVAAVAAGVATALSLK